MHATELAEGGDGGKPNISLTQLVTTDSALTWEWNETRDVILKYMDDTLFWNEILENYFTSTIIFCSFFILGVSIPLTHLPGRRRRGESDVFMSGSLRPLAD